MTEVFQEIETREILRAKAALVTYILSNDALRGFTGDDIVIAGGFFATQLNHEAHNDIDVFILNNNVSKYKYLTYDENDPDPSGAVWEIRNNGSAYLKNKHIESVALNKNTKVQYILTDYKDRKELLSDFDYVHCTTSYVPADDKLYITREAYDCIVKKELRSNKAHDLPALWRQSKFENRGWIYPIEENIYYKDHIKPGIKQIITKGIQDILDRHADDDAVLEYQTK